MGKICTGKEGTMNLTYKHYMLCYFVNTLWIISLGVLFLLILGRELFVHSSIVFICKGLCERRKQFFSGLQFLSFEGAFSLILLLTMTRREMIYDHLNRNSKNITNLFLFCGAFTFFFWNGFVVQRYFHSSLNYIVRNW